MPAATRMSDRDLARHDPASQQDVRKSPLPSDGTSSTHAASGTGIASGAGAKGAAAVRAAAAAVYLRGGSGGGGDAGDGGGGGGGSHASSSEGSREVSPLREVRVRGRSRSGGEVPALAGSASQSEDELRAAYRDQSLRGEEHYGDEQYTLAIACFNDARCALLVVAGRPEAAAERGDPGAVRLAKLQDQINSALLSERINDCHVQNYFRTRRRRHEDAGDMSHINYRSASTMILEARARLLEEIQSKHGLIDYMHDGDGEGNAVAFVGKIDAEVRDLNDLLDEATLALARIFSKEGHVSARFDDHGTALESFGDSIAAWEEAASIRRRRQRTAMHGHAGVFHSDPLVLETRDMIGAEEDADELSFSGVQSLKNTIHLGALSTALQMARSHHAVAVATASEATATTGGEEAGNTNVLKFGVAANHHLRALELISETHRLRTASNMSSLGGGRSATRFKGAIKRIVATTRIGGGRSTNSGCHLAVLTSQGDAKDITDDVGQFMKRCTLLMIQEQVCISHACFCLGLRTLSHKWLAKALENVNDLGLLDIKEEVKATLHIVAGIKGDTGLVGSSPPADMMSLYQIGVRTFSDGCDKKAQLLVHYALEALRKGLPKSAMEMLKGTVQMCESPTPPCYCEKLMHAVDAQIIIQVQDNDMNGAARAMHRRLDMVSEWVGETSCELAKNLHRLACFYSLLGHHERCAHFSEASLDIGKIYENYDALPCIKLLAVTYDNMGNQEAINQYERALSMEEDFPTMVMLMNTLSRLHMKHGGQRQALDYIDKSIDMQENDTCNESTDYDLLCATMIEKANYLSSNNNFSDAMYWYESALSSNPVKSAIHPTNLRALYNKGVTLFQNRDVVGASHAFGMILKEVDKSSRTAPSETACVLNALGSIDFVNKHYASAVQRFTECLSLRNGCLSACQRAGTLCNIASAYYMMHNYEECEKNFYKALIESESLVETSPEIRATIMCKLAYILYKHKNYHEAYSLFTDGKSERNSDKEFSIKCDSYAETCRLKLIRQNHNAEDAVPSMILLKKEDVTARTPRFEGRLIPITAVLNGTGHSDTIYPWVVKMLVALGVESSDYDLNTSPSKDKKTLCARALGCLLQQTSEIRSKYACNFEGLLVESLHSKFDTLKSLLEELLPMPAGL